jgi:hypothetical protein
MAEDRMPEMNLGDKLEAVANAVMGGPNAGAGKVQQPISITDALKTKEAASGELDKIQKQIENLEKRYETSSSEGKRLAGELKTKDQAVAKLMQEKGAIESKLTRLQPFIDRLESDPRFAQHIEGYFSGNTATRTTGAKMEDFGVTEEDFSITDALTKPNSPSAQYYHAINDSVVEDKAARIAEKVVESRLGAFTKQSQAEKAREIDRVKRDSFLKAHPDMSDSDLDLLLEKARNVDWGYDDIFAKVNPTHVAETVRRGVENDVSAHVARLGVIPGTLAGRGSADGGVTGNDPSKAVFDLIRANISPSIMEYAK